MHYIDNPTRLEVDYYLLSSVFQVRVIVFIV